MYLFPLPDLGDVKFKLQEKYEGETSGDHMDNYSYRLVGPHFKWYKLTGGIDNSVRGPKDFSTDDKGELYVSSGIFDGDPCVLSFGQEDITTLLTGKMKVEEPVRGRINFPKSIKPPYEPALAVLHTLLTTGPPE